MLVRLSLTLITLLSLALPALAQITERAYPFGRPEPEQPIGDDQRQLLSL